MTAVLTSCIGIGVSLLAFKIALFLYKRFNCALLNPLLVSAALIVILLVVTGTPLDSYLSATQALAFFLGPATVVLAYSIFVQWRLLKRNYLPILAGCFVGSLVSIASSYGLCMALGLGEDLAVSFIPKSTTMPIALTITNHLGGIVPITVAAVVTTGILGAILSPVLVRIFRVGDSIAAGVAIGTASHVAGTSKAVEMGELEGAMAGVALVITGLMSICIVLLASALMPA